MHESVEMEEQAVEGEAGAHAREGKPVGDAPELQIVYRGDDDEDRERDLDGGRQDVQALAILSQSL